MERRKLSFELEESLSFEELKIAPAPVSSYKSPSWGAKKRDFSQKMWEINLRTKHYVSYRHRIYPDCFLTVRVTNLTKEKIDGSEKKQ